MAKATAPKANNNPLAGVRAAKTAATGKSTNPDNRTDKNKVAKAAPDMIKESKNTVDGKYVAVSSHGGEHLTFPKRGELYSKLSGLAVVGASFRAVQRYIKEHKPEAKLANGLDAKSAPRSAEAAAASRTTGKAQDPVLAGLKAQGKVQAERGPKNPAPAKADAKAPTPNKAPKLAQKSAVNGRIDDGMAILVVAGENPYKAGTKAAATFDLFAKAKTVGAFKALVAKAPQNYDGGYIRYSSRDGYIKLG